MKKMFMETEQVREPKVNWEEIKNRLNFLQESLEQKVISEDEKKAIFKKRAQALALVNVDESIQKEFIEIIAFSLASENYGIETTFVREVFPLKDYTFLPGVPAFVLGILNVKGQIISVIDLKKFLHLPDKGLGELNKVIIIQNERMEFGILADTIIGTQYLSSDSIQTSLQHSGSVGSEYIKCVTREHLILLDAKKILEDEKILVNQQTEIN